jgi:hypothetical protein
VAPNVSTKKNGSRVFQLGKSGHKVKKGWEPLLCSPTLKRSGFRHCMTEQWNGWMDGMGFIHRNDWTGDSYIVSIDFLAAMIL